MQKCSESTATFHFSHIFRDERKYGLVLTLKSCYQKAQFSSVDVSILLHKFPAPLTWDIFSYPIQFYKILIYTKHFSIDMI